MNKHILYLFAYLLSQEDEAEFIGLLGQRFGNPDAFLTTREENLKKVDGNGFSVSQRVLVAAYAHLYAALRSRDLGRDLRLEAIRKRLHIAIPQARHIVHCLRFLNPDELRATGSPIRIALDPPQAVVDWATRVITTSPVIETKEHKCLEKLDPREYEHPLDKQYLDILESTPGFQTLYRKLFEHAIEPAFRIQFTGSYIKATPTSFPDVHDILVKACEILNLSPIPELYIKQGFINGMTIGAEKPIIVLDSGCFSFLTHSELLFLIGHEVGHVKSLHCLYSMMANALPMLGDMLGSVTLGVGSLVAMGVEVAVLNWQRMSEFSADRAGLLCCQDLDAAYKTLMKLSGAPPMLYSQLDPKRFIEQSREFEGYDLKKRDKVIKILSVMYQDHPWTVMRGKELNQWVESGGYEKVLGHNRNDLTSKNNEIAVNCYCTSCGARLTCGNIYCEGCGSKVAGV